MLNALDVIWINDDCITPPGPKMVVCVEPSLGYFFRINTEENWQTPVLLAKPPNDFLQHSSYLECGLPLELDDYVIEQCMPPYGRGVIGRVDKSCVAAIVAAVENEKLLSAEEKAAITLAIS